MLSTIGSLSPKPAVASLQLYLMSLTSLLPIFANVSNSSFALSWFHWFFHTCLSLKDSKELSFYIAFWLLLEAGGLQAEMVEHCDVVKENGQRF